MNKKRFVLPVVFAAVVLALLTGAYTIRYRIRRTEETLGPSAAAMDPVRRYRLVLECYGNLGRFQNPVDPARGRYLLEIGSGEDVASVISKISQGVGADPEALRLYWIYTGADRLINPGRYALSGSLTIPQITDLVTAAGKSLVRFVFFSGMRLEEIAELIDTYAFTFSGEEFLALASDYPADQHPAGMTSLEGYFVPGTYEMSREIQLEEFLANFVRVFQRRVRDPYEAAFNANGLTLHQAVILASMIAREAMSASEYGTIASVFYNRMAAGMKFESDPTAQYAIGYDAARKTWWKNPLTAADVSIYSAYNTYVVNGFPPGPICSPETAIYEAVAHPEKTGYYYFRARCDNSPYHNFSRTYEEHAAYGCE